MKKISVLSIVILLCACNQAVEKQKKWSDLEQKEKRTLTGNVDSYNQPSNLKLDDIFDDYGMPIDSINYTEKFSKDTIEYRGLLAPQVETLKEYENYVKKIEPFRARLYKQYKYEVEPNVYKLRKAYYKKMEQYEFSYKETRQNRLTRIKKMIPNWNKVYIDENKYRDLYSSKGEYHLNADLKYQNCKKYIFKLADQVTLQEAYGVKSTDQEPDRSINTFGFVVVDGNKQIRIIDGYYQFDENKYAAAKKKKDRDSFIGSIIGMILIGSFIVIRNRIKYTFECTHCGISSYVKKSITLEDTKTEKYLTNGRYNKDGSLDQRYNTEFDYSTTYYYKAHCSNCNKNFKFESSKRL